jgi:uncharacterized protein (TIGR00369 family)
MRELPCTHSCFVCGDSNVSGLRLRFKTDGRVVQTQFVPGSQHVGFKETVHGGLIATILDETMVWACAVATRRFAFCAELGVRFLSPARPGDHTVAIAELVVNRRDRIFEAKAELRNSSGTLLAVATGKYLPIKDADSPSMLADLKGDSSLIFGSQKS